jgi:N6-L-threonylcarbamoyladenine synthase
VDDAIGEAYDKCAKILGLGYPGGPLIDRLAQSGDPEAFSFTKPKQDGRYDFSFSGIKTAALLLCEREKRKVRSRKFLENFCASFQEAVIRWVVEKTCLACEEEGIRAIVVGGGVSANSRLRSRLADEAASRGCQLFIPPLTLTTDNAAMIARLGFSLFRKGRRSNFGMEANPSLKIGEESNGHPA